MTSTASTARSVVLSAAVAAAVLGCLSARAHATTPAAQAAGAAASTVGGLAVSVGYAEDKEINTPTPAAFPVPWAGSPNTLFLGSTVPGQTACGTLTVCYDTGAIRFDNPGPTPITVGRVSVDMHSSLTGGKVFDNLWGSFAVPAGASVILAANPPANNPTYDNFDTSGYPGNQCTPLTVAPTVTVTIGGTPATLVDSTHVLDTGGIDAGYCKQNESIQWRPIGAAGHAAATLTLGPPGATAPLGQQVDEVATLLDGAGVGLPDATVGFTVTSGPDLGRTGTAVTDAQGHATFRLAGAAEGEDVISAQVATVGSFRSGTARVLWTDDAATGWSGADLAGAAPAGSQALDAATGTWTVTGGASATAALGDGLHLLSRSSPSVDGGIGARIAALTGPAASSGAGVMLRAGTGAGAPFYSAVATVGGAIVVRARTSSGAAPVILARLTGGAPAWLWVARTGTALTAFTSSDGYVWDPVGGSTIALDLGAAPLAGITVESGQTGQLATAHVDHVVVSALPPAPPPPLPCPAPWTCADIGNPVPAGSQSFDPSGARWTIDAAGADITGSSDQFRLVSQPLSGDTSISARVQTQTATSTSAKAGVMLRAGTDPAAAYYGVFVTPGTGIKVQRRSVPGGATTKLANPPGAAPAYVKVARVGSTFTAYTSPDGATWSLITGSTTVMNLPPTVLAGLAVTSHKPGALGEVTMTAVQTN